MRVKQHDAETTEKHASVFEGGCSSVKYFCFSHISKEAWIDRLVTNKIISDNYTLSLLCCTFYVIVCEIEVKFLKRFLK